MTLPTPNIFAERDDEEEATPAQPNPFPPQPLGWDATGKVIRFKENTILTYIQCYLSVNNSLTENDVHKFLGLTEHMYQQGKQMVGYSLSGWGGMSQCCNALELPGFDEEAEAIDARRDLVDMVLCKPTPIQPFVRINGMLHFLENIYVHEFVKAYGLKPLAREVGHIYSPLSLDDFSQVLQATGISYVEYLTWMNSFRRAEYCDHFKRTQEAFAAFEG